MLLPKLHYDLLLVHVNAVVNVELDSRAEYRERLGEKTVLAQFFKVSDRENARLDTHTLLCSKFVFVIIRVGGRVLLKVVD